MTNYEAFDGNKRNAYSTQYEWQYSTSYLHKYSSLVTKCYWCIFWNECTFLMADSDWNTKSPPRYCDNRVNDALHSQHVCFLSYQEVGLIRKYFYNFVTRCVTIYNLDTWFWYFQKTRKCFNNSSICFSIDGFFSDFDDKCFFSKEIFYPFKRFTSASWFHLESNSHSYLTNAYPET